jgi:diaminopimelate epimerase
VTTFYRVSGAGNDFIALVEQPLPAPEQVRAWCRRGLSIGADGLFVLAPAAAGSVRMTHFNADGGEAALCINGTRCAARLAVELGWARADGSVTIETGAGPLSARRQGPTEIALEVPPPSRPVADRIVDLEGRRIAARFVTVGVPHLVVDCPEGVAAAPVAELGSRLRHHPDFAPAGTNVDFAAWAAPGRLEIRSFERGVEAETLACGTGVLAAVAAGLAAGRASLPVRATTRGGFVLSVGGVAEGGGVRSWSLAGDARIVAEGRLRPEAEGLPASPPWG